MLAIIAMISDIPAYIAELISKISGADTSAFVEFFNNAFAQIIEAVEKILGA